MHKSTLCWRCIKAYGGCRWAWRFLPVPGWEAQQTTLLGPSAGSRIDSYHVISCPEFEADPKFKQEAKQMSQKDREAADMLAVEIELWKKSIEDFKRQHRCLSSQEAKILADKEDILHQLRIIRRKHLELAERRASK